MALSFTTDDIRRLEGLSRTLLNPFTSDGRDAWLLETGAQMRDLFGGALFQATPFADPDFRVVSPDAPSVAEAIASFTHAAANGTLGLRDRVMETLYATYGPSAITTLEGNRRVVEPLGLRMEESLFVSEACKPAGIEDFAGIHEHTPAGFASLVVMSETRGGLRFGDDIADVLRVVAPAFRAGLDALARLGGFRHTLDAVADPLVALDPDGRELHRNPALVALLDRDLERTVVEGALWHLTRDLRRLVFAGGPLAPMQRTVATAAGTYRLSASIVPPGALQPTETAVVSVAFAEAPEAAASRAADEARTRYGLTSREAEIALLLVEGSSNPAIADRLFISPATVKRHVERVLAKLDVANRTAVAARLLQPALSV